MATTYDYSNRRMSRDWHLVGSSTVCNLRGIRIAVDGPACINCYYRAGTENNLSDFVSDNLYFVKCKHPQAQDTDGCEHILYRIHEELEQEALAFLCS